MTYPREFLQAIPKTDLHLHLDGSLRLDTLIELAREEGIKLPSETPEGLTETVFKPRYANLDEYLAGFAWTVAVMQRAEHLERVAYELAHDNADEGVRYIEVRFAPQLHIHPQLSFEQVLEAVDRGLRRARDEINAQNATTGNGAPPFEYGIIVTAMRFFMPQFSTYFGRLAEVHPHADAHELARSASYELARATVQLRDRSEVQIVGFDLAGSEHGYPAGNHKAAFEFVHKHFINKTVHAGEAYGPESIFQAITDLHADRIGHGFHLFDAKLIRTPEISDPERYVQNLIDYIADNRITIEVCLTSNLQTSPYLESLRDHSVSKMLEYKLSIAICTDNRLVSHTSVTRELEQLLNNADVSPKQLKNIIVYGFKRSFFYLPYNEKREYVRAVIDHFDRVAQQYGFDAAG